MPADAGSQPTPPVHAALAPSSTIDDLPTHNKRGAPVDGPSPTAAGSPNSVDTGPDASKKRRTGPGSRGVANLTPEQLAKKRANGTFSIDPCDSLGRSAWPGSPCIFLFPDMHPPCCRQTRLTGSQRVGVTKADHHRPRSAKGHSRAHKEPDRGSRAQDPGSHVAAALPRLAGRAAGQGSGRG